MIDMCYKHLAPDGADDVGWEEPRSGEIFIAQNALQNTPMHAAGVRRLIASVTQNAACHYVENRKYALSQATGALAQKCENSYNPVTPCGV